MRIKWIILGAIAVLAFIWVLGCGLDEKVDEGVKRCQSMVEKIITDLEHEYSGACLTPDDIIDLMLDNLDAFEETICNTGEKTQ